MVRRQPLPVAKPALEPLSPTSTSPSTRHHAHRSRPDIVDELVEKLADLGANHPTKLELSVMSDAELIAYADSVDAAAEMLRSLEPSSADRFAERYAFNELNFPDDWTLKQGVMDLLAIILRPQVVHDGTLGGSHTVMTCGGSLFRINGSVEFIRGGPDLRDIMTCQLIHP